MKKVNLVVPIIIVGGLAAATVFLFRNYSAFGWNDYGGYHMVPGMMGSWGMNIMMLLFWGLVLVVLVQMINRLLQSDFDKTGAPDRRPDAVELLKQRYAKGEVNQEEFKTMVHNLKNTT
jgi:putative membrane protein